MGRYILESVVGWSEVVVVVVVSNARSPRRPFRGGVPAPPWNSFSGGCTSFSFRLDRSTKARRVNQLFLRRTGIEPRRSSAGLGVAGARILACPPSALVSVSCPAVAPPSACTDPTVPLQSALGPGAPPSPPQALAASAGRAPPHEVPAAFVLSQRTFRPVGQHAGRS